MSISRDLYKNLPYYLRMLDEQGSGMLKHLTDPTQTQLDKWTDAKGTIELIENPDTIPKSWAYWAQQKVGGAGTRERWLGIGVHPDWPVERMRRFLLEGWNYWNTKGTQTAIRWAIDFWLDWEKAQNPIYLEFRKPFGDRPTSELPQWWSYTTPYGTHATQHYTEFQFWGGGDYPQQYQPDYRSLRQNTWLWEFETVWDDRQLVLSRPPEIDNSRSGLGPRNVWMHFHLDESEWNKIAPDIHKLNPETWHILARPQVFLWQDIETSLKLIEDPEFPIARTRILYDIDGFQFGDIFPWPENQPPRIETQTVHRAWQPDPYFQFGDFWGGIGGEIVPHEDRFRKVEEQRFSPFWTAYNFLASVVKVVTIPGTAGEEILIPTAVSVSNELGTAFSSIVLKISGDRIVVGADYQSLYGFEPSPAGASELWQSAALRSTADEQIEVIEEVEAIGFNGAQYTDTYAWEIPEILTQTISTAIRYLPGATFQDCFNEVWTFQVEDIVVVEVEIPRRSGGGTPWTIARGAWLEIIDELIPGIPEISEPSTTHLWYVPYREWDEDIEVEIPGVQNCWAGLLADVEESEYEVVVPAVSTFPPRLWGHTVPETQSTLTTPGSPGSVGADFLSPYLGYQFPLTIAYDLEPISLNEIFPLAIALAPIAPLKFNPFMVHDFFADENQSLGVDDWWQYPSIPPVETITTVAGGFRFDDPQLCFQYLDTYTNCFEWYSSGETSQVTTKIDSATQQYQLCNVVDNFTLRKIENWREISEPLPESERAIEKAYPLLQEAAKQQSWTLSVETDEELMLVEPLVFFTEKDGQRSLAIELERKLNLEFVFIVGRFTHIRSISLFVGHEIVESKTYTIPLNVHPKDKIGFRFTLTLQPATGLLR